MSDDCLCESIQSKECKAIKHVCSCLYTKCKAEEHLCVCRDVDPIYCKGGRYHDCVCPLVVSEYATVKISCKSELHKCVCVTSTKECVSGWHECSCSVNVSMCKGKVHHCICPKKNCKSALH